ncbi:MULTISPECIES: amidohydrolase [unclassified Sinorhizobium]|uniref:amidohydrolase family protein n=1 Tax=unclassified Sinorhizobium TaxID=2613772 RepID=UPI0035258F79
MVFSKSYIRRSFLAGSATAIAAPLVIRNTFAQTGRRPKTIVDGQVNIWTGGKPPPTRRQTPFLATDLLTEMTAAGVARAVIIPVSWNPDGVESPLAAVRAYPDRFRVFGIYDLAAPPERASIDLLMKREGIAGLRLFLNSSKGQAWMTDGSGDWFWPIIEQRKIPLMIYPTILPALQQVIEKYPGMKLCIDSLGAIPGKDGLDGLARHDSILALAKFPNVVIKASGLPQQSASSYPFDNLTPYLRKTYDTFGPERMFWGSDITSLEPLKVTYNECIDSFTRLSWLSDRDLDLIMGRSISEWMGWPLPAQ